VRDERWFDEPLLPGLTGNPSMFANPFFEMMDARIKSAHG
jgi:hypothetical protein